jgi:hypothetical protein
MDIQLMTTTDAQPISPMKNMTSTVRMQKTTSLTPIDSASRTAALRFAGVRIRYIRELMRSLSGEGTQNN